MASILRIKFEQESNQALTDRAREILEMAGSNEIITVTDPKLLLEIERVNTQEVECKLYVDYAEGKSSYGYYLNEELRGVLYKSPPKI